MFNCSNYHLLIEKEFNIIPKMELFYSGIKKMVFELSEIKDINLTFQMPSLFFKPINETNFGFETKKRNYFIKKYYFYNKNSDNEFDQGSLIGINYFVESICRKTRKSKIISLKKFHNALWNIYSRMDWGDKKELGTYKPSIILNINFNAKN